MDYFLKTEVGQTAADLDQETAQKILKRGRHQGRRIVETFVLHPDGIIDRYKERAQRKLGSNAIAARTWLSETYTPGEEEEWSNDRYIPNPEEAISETDPEPQAVILVLLGAENDDAQILEQLSAIKAGH